MASLVVAVGATGAFYLINRSKSTESTEEPIHQDVLSKNETSSKKQRRNKKKNKTQSSSTSQDSIVSEINIASVSVEKSMTELAELCNKSVDELMPLDPENKQKVFYALLLKGEATMNSGDLDKAVECFVKACTIVPNPSEIIAAFEKSLPQPVFEAFLMKLQDQVMKRTEKYFELLSDSSNGHIKFTVKDIIDLLGKPHKQFMPVAKCAIKKGEILYEEKPDIVAITDLSIDPSGYCDFTLKKITDGPSYKFEDAVYCSEEARVAGIDQYRMYVSEKRPEALNALQSLNKYCKDEAKNGQALLMLRYVSMLLTEELKGNGTAVNGPFAHYDHLPQMFPSPTDADKKEAAIIRSIFTTTEENLAEFLTDQIYASMKATLIRASFSFNLDNPLALNNLDKVNPFRKVIGDNQDCDATAFYHLSAHLAHSCYPNVELEVIPSTGSKIRAVALKDIATGEPLNISYIPVEGMEREMRKEKLFLNFMLDCKCTACA